MGRSVSIVLALVLAAGACSGSADSPIATLSRGTDGEVDAAGGIVTWPFGVTADFAPGTFPGGAAIAASAAPAPSVPAGAVLRGEAFAITSSDPPEIPVLLEVPIPDGTPAEDLYLLRIPDDGLPQFIGGSVEGEVFVAAVPGFSTFTLATYDAADLLASLGLPDAGGEAGDEHTALVVGELSRAAARSTRVIGPGELLATRAATYAAHDFVTTTPRLLRHQWRVWGPARPVGPTTDASIVVEGLDVGRALVTVEVTDPRLGVSAFASRRVFVVASDQAGVYLSPNQTEYAPGDAASVLVVPRNMTAPFTIDWSTDGGARGVEQAEGATDIDIGRLRDDTVLTVVVTDASGTVIEQALGLVVGAGEDDCHVVGFVGPLRATVGVPLSFDLITPVPPPSFTVGVEPSGTAATSGGVATVTFTEPGLASIAARGQSGLCLGWIGGSFVLVEGLPQPLAVRFESAPESGAADAAIEIVAAVTGGVVSTVDGVQPYTGTVDWGDGETATFTVEATTATAWNEIPLGHAYGDPGDYEITITVMSSDGQTAGATHSISVASGGGRFEGSIVEFDDADTDIFTVVRNRVVVVVDGESIEVRRLNTSWESRYKTFTIGDETRIADCLGTGSRTLLDADLFFNENGRIRGTIRLREVHDDAGPECPFGGTHYDRIWTGEVRGRIEDGVLTMTLTGNAEGRPEQTFTVRATPTP